MGPRSIRLGLQWTALLALASFPVSAQRPLSEVRAVFANRDAHLYDEAADAFLEVLRDGGDARMLGQLALVMPEELLREVPPRVQGVSWWALQDPLPSTRCNERLIEHLTRVATAESEFPDDGPLGFDVRGETFVRYGRPARRVSINVESDLFIARALRAEPSIRRADFPANTVWHYPDLSSGVYFLFVQGRGGYRLGGALDLVPRSLLAGGLTPTTQTKAELLAQVLRWIYKELYPFSDEYKDRLMDMDAVVGADGRAFDGPTGLVVQGELQKARRSDEIDRVDRESIPSRARTRVQPSGFGVVYAPAAFRDSSGGYSVWVGWSLPDEAHAAIDSLAELGLRPDSYSVETTEQVLDSRAERLVSRSESHELPGRVSTPTWLRLAGIPRDGSAAVEWALVPTEGQGLPVPFGVVAAQVLRVPPPDGTELISDLLAVDAASAAAMEEIDRLGAFPKPRRAGPVARGESLAVYFELYGPAGSVYRVETRAVLIREGGIFRRSREQHGATASDVRLEGLRQPVTAVLDTGTLDGADHVRVEVTVRDLATGEETRRALAFDLN